MARATPASSWERFDEHTPWIRNMTLEFAGNHNTEIILHILRSRSTRPFPFLRNITLTIYDSPHIREVIPWLLHTCSTVKTLEIDFWAEVSSSDPPEVHNEIIASSIDILRAIHPLELEQLSLRAVAQPLSQATIVLDEVTAVINTQRNLRHLEVHDFEGRFKGPWEAASQLQKLLRLSFTAPSCPFPLVRTEISSKKTNDGFASLVGVDVEMTLEAIPTFLSSITSSGVEVLDILVETPAEELNPKGFLGVLNDVTRFTALSAVWLVFPTTFAQWADIAPLLACTKMKTIILRGYQLSKVIGDGEIEAMGRAWPGLRGLQLEDTMRTPPRYKSDEAGVIYPPAATLRGLSCLAVLCPDLWSLGLSIDARGMANEGPVRHPALLVEDLEFPCSYVDGDEVDVALFITQMWPNQSKDWVATDVWGPGWGDPYMRSEGSISGPMGKNWSRIWGLVFAHLNVSSI